MDAVQVRSDKGAVVPFSPGSLLWEWAGDIRGGIFGPTVGFLQGAHPVVAAGVWQHSTVWKNPYTRGWRSLDATQRWVYGGQQAYDEAKRLRDIHKDVKGTDFEGNRYHALNAEPFAWVWATGWLAYVGTLRAFSTELVTRELEERLYEEFKNLGRILGVVERLIPVTLEAFETYFDGMIEQLAAGQDIIDPETIQAGFELFGNMPPPPHVPKALWRPVGWALGRVNFFYGVGYAPQFLREEFAKRVGYHWTPRRERRLRRVVAIMKKVGPHLPELLRYPPPAYLYRRRYRRANRANPATR